MSNGKDECPATHFCGLNLIDEYAERIGREIGIGGCELSCDSESIAVREGMIVKLTEAVDGKCPVCNMAVRVEKRLTDVAVCPHCHALFTTTKDGCERWFLSEYGIALFVAKKLAHGWTQWSNGAFHLGEVNGRNLYFSIKPSRRFFNNHQYGVSLVYAGGEPDIPENWKGKVTPFSEIFYWDYEKHDIGIAPNIKNKLLPSKGLKRGKDRVIHERRDDRLCFLCHLVLNPEAARPTAGMPDALPPPESAREAAYNREERKTGKNGQSRRTRHRADFRASVRLCARAANGAAGQRSA